MLAVMRLSNAIAHIWEPELTFLPKLPDFWGWKRWKRS
jgi:hypothetical protein